MARTQSPDYDKRRGIILNQAARLYAKHGFLGASAVDLAKACKTSKSLIYHYFPSKEKILFGVMSSHLEDLTAITDDIAARPDLPPEERLRQLTLCFVQAYVGAASSHKVLLNELDNLPADKRRIVVDRQREIIATVEGLILEIRPDIADMDQFRRPISMLFFGMINWTHTWYNPKGPVSPGALATLVFDVMMNGLREFSPEAHAS